MDAYLDIVQSVLEKGSYKNNRTGIPTYSITGEMFEHDMSEGFPLLTTKRMPFGMISSELEFFIKGITDKKWLQDRKNPIWDHWAWQEKVPYGHDIETQNKMLLERDLGPIYGFQWRHFDAEYNGFDKDYTNYGIDQLEQLINTLKKDPNDRRMIISAWNPNQLADMALPPCHYGFQVTVTEDKLNLLWNQRSVDTGLGLPFNIASYGLMLHLLAKETGFDEGKLIGFLGDVHIYENQISGLEKQLTRNPFELPSIETENFDSIFNWEYTDSNILNYKNHGKLDLGKPAI
jgi:thymidylate synthase